MSEQITDLAAEQQAFSGAIKKATEHYGKGKQYLWDAGDHAKRIRSQVPHGSWDDHCRNVLGYSRAWVGKLIRFRDSVTRDQAAFIGSVDEEVKQLGSGSNVKSTLQMTPELEEKTREIKASLLNAREELRGMALEALNLKAKLGDDRPDDLSMLVPLLWDSFPDIRSALNATDDDLDAFSQDYVGLILIQNGHWDDECGGLAEEARIRQWFLDCAQKAGYN